LEEVEGWDGGTKGGELTVFEPYVVEVYEISVSETEDVDFLEHLLLNRTCERIYSIQVFVIITHRDLPLETLNVKDTRFTA